MEIDVFGRQTLSTIAAGKEAQASAEGRNATMRSLSAQIGAAWYDLVAAREQLQIIEQQVAAGQEMLELIELRYEAEKVLPSMYCSNASNWPVPRPFCPVQRRA